MTRGHLVGAHYVWLGNAESLRLEALRESGLTWPIIDSGKRFGENRKRKNYGVLRQKVIKTGKQKRTLQTKGRAKD